LSLLTYIHGEKLLDRITDRIRSFVDRHELVYLFVSGDKDSALLLLATSYLPEELRKKLIVVYTEIVENTHQMNIEQAYSLIQRLLPEAMERVERVDAVRQNMVRVASMRIQPPAMIHIRAHNHDYQGKTFLDTMEMLGIGCVRASYARNPMEKRWCMLQFKYKWWTELRAIKGIRPLIVGVKTSDSIGRQRRWKDVDPNMPVKTFDTPTGLDVALAPLVDMTSAEVTALLRQYNIVLRTYEMYGDSLNCMFCPFRGKDKIPRCVEAMPMYFARRLLNTLRNLRSQSKFVRQVVEKWVPELERKLGVVE